MNGRRVLVASLSILGLLAVFALDWWLRTHVVSVALVTVMGALALAEIYPLFRRMGLESYPEYGVVVLSVLFLVRGLLGHAGIGEEAVRALVLVLFAGFVVAPFYPLALGKKAHSTEQRRPYERIAVTLLGLLLVWYTLSFLLELRLLGLETGEARIGLKLTLALLLTVKLGDSAAYLVGKTIGVRPLSRISPRKTWEGAAGSLIGSILVSAAAGGVLGFSVWRMALFGIVVNLAGQLGDLLESLLKRRAGVKDSGRFFRESGGFLDLLDSLLLAAPVGYVFARFVVL